MTAATSHTERCRYVEGDSGHCIRPAAHEGPHVGNKTGIRAPDDVRPYPLVRLVKAARHWALFQDADSVEDQKTDRRLAIEAADARIELRLAVAALSDEQQNLQK